MTNGAGDADDGDGRTVVAERHADGGRRRAGEREERERGVLRMADCGGEKGGMRFDGEVHGGGHFCGGGGKRE